MEVSIDQLFEFSNEMSEYVIADEEAFKNYLKTAAFTGRYTVANQLLIQGYMNGINGQTAHDVRSEEEWAQFGIIVNRDMPIYIMEYSPKEEKRYIPRRVYDISQTNAMQPTYVYDAGQATEALLMSKPCEIEFVEVMKIKGKKAIYTPDKERIEVTSGFENFSEIFFDLASEYAHYYKHQDFKEQNGDGNVKKIYPRAANNYAAYMASYVTGAAYGLEDGFKIEMPKYDKGKTPAEIKRGLGEIVIPASKSIKAANDKLIEIYNMQNGVSMERVRE